MYLGISSYSMVFKCSILPGGIFLCLWKYGFARPVGSINFIASIERWQNLSQEYYKGKLGYNILHTATEWSISCFKGGLCFVLACLVGIHPSWLLSISSISYRENALPVRAALSGIFISSKSTRKQSCPSFNFIWILDF